MSATQHLLRFGVFEINLTTEELRKSGTAVKLPPQPLRLLILLAGRAGQVVSREEIQQTFWGGETDINFERRMNQCIQQVRTALGDDASHPLYMETIHRHGYRFIAPVEAKRIVVPGPRLIESDSSRVSRGTGSSAEAPAVMAGAVAPDYQAAPNAVLAAPAPARDVADLRQSSPRGWRTRFVWIGIAVLVVVVMIGGGLYWRAHRKPVLTEKDTIVLADFDNKTGDAVFDDTLKLALTVQLAQSPFLNILSEQRVAETLALMERPAHEPLNVQLAREVCVRTRSTATLEGAIAMLGDQYVLALRAVNCRTGDVLGQAQVTVPSKNKVLSAMDEAASRVRSELGESLASVQKFDVPVSNATTPSLEALKYFTLGYRTSDDAAAVPLFQAAVKLDPDFAAAYYRLGVAYNNLGEPSLAAENYRRAYELRDRVSEPERLAMVAAYEANVTGDLPQAQQAYQLWIQIYPRLDAPRSNLGGLYMNLGQWDKALEMMRKALELRPDSQLNYANLVQLYVFANRANDAESTAKTAHEQNRDSVDVHSYLYLANFLQRDGEGMAREAAYAIGKPGYEDVIFYYQSDTAAYHGQYALARALTNQAVESSKHQQQNETAANYLAESAVREAFAGNAGPTRQRAQAAVHLAPGKDVKAWAAIALALAGDTVAAKYLAQDLRKQFPESTIVQFNYLPSIDAAIALHDGDPYRAIKHLEPASPYELGVPNEIFNFALYPIYLRGEAFLAARKGSQAAVQFQAIIDHPGVGLNQPIAALAHLQLGRAQLMMGDKGAAHKSYQNFLTLWKDADPDIPIYQQAKAEYARLR